MMQSKTPMSECLLLSIKPCFAHDILDGKKQFEFRRVIFRRSVQKVVVYASSPECRVIGEFRIDKVISLRPDRLWAKTKHSAGITKAFFDSYFAGKQKAHAIKVKAPRRYRKPMLLTADLGIGRAPQSFCYCYSRDCS
jgi:predicted transcriptional regulator